ncbi:MAG: host-nuclease inhibitor Gam family protein [Candidatus Latescibacteria bacterium]|nr:host-nuclease inhibitor Gam family protein [Candidatus Latescibacterota bacterium]
MDEQQVEDVDVTAEVTMAEPEKSLKKLAYWNAEAKQVKDHAAREREKIATWETDSLSDITSRQAYHQSVLRAYLQSTRKKSVKLINGAIKSRAGKDKVVFVESDGVTVDKKRTLFMDWARTSRPDLVETVTTEKTDANDVMRAAKENGEVFPGIDIVQGDTSYSYETT